MKEGEIILEVLRGIGRRLWLGRMLQDVFFGLCVLLFFLIAFKAAGPVRLSGIPAVGMAVWLPVGITIAAFVAYLVWRVSRRVTLSQAAAQADAQAVLHDELASAYWFVSNSEQSPFIELQVTRAAATASRLDPHAIVPGRPPRGLIVAAGLGMVLALVTWIAPQLSNSWNVPAAAAVPAHMQPQDLRALLQDAPQDAQIEKLDQALETLQRTDATAEQKIRAAAEMRDAAEQANMEAAAAREGVARLAEALKANPKFDRLAEALETGRNEEAMALLEELRNEAAQQEAAGKDEEQFPAAEEGKAFEGSMAEQLDQAGRNLAGLNASVNPDTIDKALKALDEATEKMDVQNRINQVKRRTQESLAVTSQRSALAANEFGSRSDMANPTPLPQNGNADMQGGTMFRDGAVQREEDADGPREGSKTGSAAGQSQAMALEGRKTERLEAQLKLEAIQRRDDKNDNEDEKDDKNWIYSASQQQASALGLEDLRGRKGFDREAAAGHERIPIRQKQVVKDYFLNLHESERK